jgi:hypothetical protein
MHRPAPFSFMGQSLAVVALIVRDCDEAVRW